MNRLRSQLAAPGFRAAWQLVSSQVQNDFRAFVDKEMGDTPVNLDPNKLVSGWKTLAAAELSKARGA